MARRAALLGLAVALAGALYWWQPFLSRERLVVTSTPSPGPIGPSVGIPLGPGSRACVAPAAIDRSTGQAQFTLAPRTQPASVVLEAEAPGYRSRREVTIAPNAKAQSVRAPLASPPHDVTGSICVRNAGRSPIGLAGTNNPVWIGLATTSVDGRKLDGQAVALTLLEPERQSLLDRLGTIVHRASDFTGHLMPFWLAWVLVVALVIGTPFAVFAAFWATLRTDEPG
ncbi:MAG TPA: hypothetical protein VF257_02685 [Solirubrobacteraceae bacterium]